MSLKSWAEIGFRIEITSDQSPTLRLLHSVVPEYAEGEAMHHSGGAAVETDLIYAECIRQVYTKIDHPHFLVVGLGLGYIEMFIAKESILRGKKPASILSFESIPGLREGFWKWVHGKDLPLEIQATYDDAMKFILNEEKIPTQQLKDFLKEYFPSLESIREALEEDTSFPVKYHGILYDAFSSKTSPLLWEEGFLNDLIRQVSQPQAWFATYACKGSLKRALRNQGYELLLFLGFKSKRNRVSAVRNINS